MRVFIHIGDGRTGTTSLQSLWSKNRTLLRSFNIDYPAVALLGEGKGIAQHLLSFSLMKSWPDFALSAQVSKEDAWSALRSHMETSLSPDHSLLISSEGFCTLPEEGIEYIKNFFAGCEIIPIFVRRAPEEWRTSMREHRIKNGVHLPTPKYPAKDLSVGKLNRWKKFFNVKLIEYSKKCHEELHDIIEVPLDRLEPVRRENSKPHPSLTDLLNELNAIELRPENRNRINKIILRWGGENLPQK